MDSAVTFNNVKPDLKYEKFLVNSFKENNLKTTSVKQPLNLLKFFYTNHTFFLTIECRTKIAWVKTQLLISKKSQHLLSRTKTVAGMIKEACPTDSADVAKVLLIRVKQALQHQ